MKKKVLLLTALCLLVTGFLPALAQTPETQVPKPPATDTLPQATVTAVMPQEPALYTISLWVGCPVSAQMDKASQQLGYIPKGHTVEVLEVHPYWLKVRYQGTLAGYIKRSNTLDASVKVLDPVNTPQYSAVLCEWLGWVKGDAPVLTAPQAGAEVLLTLHDGARVALIDITDGWAKVIYHRQYGYIDTRLLSEIQSVNKSHQQGSDAPIAAYTSFYKITTDQSNLNRMINLQVANQRFGLYTLAKGDSLDFNNQIGPYTRRNGYQPANAFVKGEVVQSYGGGTCQISSTLYNVVLQLPSIAIVKRRPHGQAAASYLPHGADAAVGSSIQNFIIQNLYDFPVRIDGTAQDGALTIAIYRAD